MQPIYQMNAYECKYCGRVVVRSTENTVKSHLPELVDHLMLKHYSKGDEIGSIYLSDIPKQCYVARPLKGETA